MFWRAYALLSHGRDRIGLGVRRMGAAAAPLHRPDEVLSALERLDEAVWTANALAAAAEGGLLPYLRDPATPADIAARLGIPEPAVTAMLDVLAGLGLVRREGPAVVATPGFRPFTEGAGAEAFRAALRAPLLQAEAFRRDARARSLSLAGWRFEDAEVIEAQGALTSLWAETAVAKLRFLPGLVPTLERPGAALLDVGAGAAGLSVTLCRGFPHLSAVALEPAPHPASVAERSIRAAGLEGRIALRRLRVEHLQDEAAYDLAFLPQMFLPDPIIAAATRTVFRALRPGGWLLAASLARAGGDVRAAVARLKNLLWGANVRTADDLKPLLVGAGFSPVIRSPGGGVIRMICARRPPA